MPHRKSTKLLSIAKEKLNAGSVESVQLEINWLSEQFLNLSAIEVLQNVEKPISQEQEDQFLYAVDRRAAGEPLAYILGYREFYGLRFNVKSGVLIPRPETEFVVEEALRRWPFEGQKILDMGCGSGCIGLTLLKRKVTASLLAIDAEEIPVDVTKQNAELLQLAMRADVRQLAVEKVEGQFDVVVANPPYIAHDDSNVAPDVKKYEPARALFAPENGLECLRLWSEKAAEVLPPGGLLVVEIGAGQEGPVHTILSQSFRDIEQKRDYSGWVRVISAVKKE